MPLQSVIISHLKFCYSYYEFFLASLPIRCTRNKNYIFDISRKSFWMFWKWYTFLNDSFHFYIYCLHQHIEDKPGPNIIILWNTKNRFVEYFAATNIFSAYMQMRIPLWHRMLLIYSEKLENINNYLRNLRFNVGKFHKNSTNFIKWAQINATNYAYSI